MSFSPVPGAGTLLRVEEVRQRLNQCGLQGEKLTRKTFRKYVPPTVTASRTVADMARRLGSGGSESGATSPTAAAAAAGGAKDARGSTPTGGVGRSGDGGGHSSNGPEEKIVTGEVYRTFSIHTRNIHKKFSALSDISSEHNASAITTSSSITATAATMSKKTTTHTEAVSSSQKSPVENKEVKTHTANANNKFSTVPTKNTLTPKNATPAPHVTELPCTAINNTPVCNKTPPPTLPKTHVIAQKSSFPNSKVSPNTSQHTDNQGTMNKNSRTPAKSDSEMKNTTVAPNAKIPAEANKATEPSPVNTSIKDKAAMFIRKLAPVGNKEASVNSASVHPPKDTNQNHQPKCQISPKPDPLTTKTIPETNKQKSHPNANAPEAKPCPPKPDNKTCHQAKSVQPSGRRNIQELKNSSELLKKSPKVPRKDSADSNNKPSINNKEEMFKKHPATEKTVPTKPTNTSATNSSNKPTSPFHNNINNTLNNNIINTNTSKTPNTAAVEKPDKPIAIPKEPKVDNKEQDKPTSKSDINSNFHVVSSTNNEGSGEAAKTNGTVEPMDCTGVCFYKTKCLQDPARMGSKEKVKVDESEPSFYEEAPFERRDVTVKSDRWVTDLYNVDSLLGKGKFGEVKKCQERKTGRQLAAKFIEVNGPQDRNDVLNELEIMKNLQHPRLLQLYDAFEIRDKFCLVMELVNGGELFERVINEDFILTEKACVMFTRQICDGVAFMHTQNILHLDMKPENILCLTREGNRIKIIDFGLARKYNPKDDLRVLFGTPEFVAPEVVNFDPISPSTDMWSIGVICYVLLSGLSPFMGESEQETLANVTLAHWDFSAEEFDSISSEAKDFISKLLVKDPRKRMKSSDCLEHQWLRRSVKREGNLPERSLSKKRLRKFVYRRKWQKAINAMLALRRMGVTLS